MQDYFYLPEQEQRELLKRAEDDLDISDVAIEKDIWICWLLDKIFSLPVPMAFKGGTSLSRVFNLINRYSEDIDITIDYRKLTGCIDLPQTSRSQLKKISEQLKKELIQYVSTTILPYLEESIAGLDLKHSFKISISDNGEQLKFFYPSMISKNGPQYLRDHILLEFGMRNAIEPCENHVIEPLLSQHGNIKKLFILPQATVDVLSPLRTFWEKATLMHVECHRHRLDKAPDRLSRHWYDLAMLAQSWVAKEALDNRHILESVVEYKKAFFNASYANYDDCLNGQLQLLPQDQYLLGLKRDYESMKSAGFFSETPMPFNEIVTILSDLTVQINQEILPA